MTDLELSSSILLKDPHESGGTSVWSLKYWTTASTVLLLTVVTWNIRPCFLLQQNHSWVKDNCDLSSFITLSVMWWCGIISWYHLPTSVNFHITIHLQRVSFALRVNPVFPIPFRVIWFKNMLARFSRIYSKVAKSHLIIFKEGDQI